jgi:hypothetical protein
LLESKPFHQGLFGKLSIEEELQYGDTPKDIQHALRQRATEYIQEYARDRYPSWWEVYDENGKHISRMSPQHKASLAEMRRFNNLSPEEKYKWLCEFREQSDNYLRSAGFKETTAGEKFAEVIEGFFAFLLALFRSPEDNDQPAPQPA